MVRKLEKMDELLESGRIVATAFLHDWNEKEAKEKLESQLKGEMPRVEEAWGLFNEAGKMTGSIITMPKKHIFNGHAVSVGDIHMVASLPEERGNGNVTAMLREVLLDFKKKGYAYATLIPFSFAFYRRYGFDLAQRNMKQRAAIEQLRNFRCDMNVRMLELEDEVAIIRKLYDAFIQDKNLAVVKNEDDWIYRGNGEYGKPDWRNGNKHQYTYIFRDECSNDRGYMKFIFRTGEKGPFIGEMDVQEIIYDNPKVFCQMLGFIYGMRAKLTHVNFDLLEEIDLALLLPECDDVERRLEGHFMARVLDVEKILSLMQYPVCEGKFSIRVIDDYLTENTGSYYVKFANGKAVSIERGDSETDMTVTVDTFMQLAIGRCDLYAALFRKGTSVAANRDILERIFIRRAICIG